MRQEFQYERVLKSYDSTQSTFREDDRSTICTHIGDPGEALPLLLRPILWAFRSSKLPLGKLSIKAAGPFPNGQWLTELDLDFSAVRVEFRIRTLNVPCSLARIYQSIKCLGSFKFLHLRYVALNEEDEQVLKVILEEQHLVVLFIGVVSMEGRIFMEALRKNTSVQTVALIWLHLEPIGHYFPVLEFCQSLHHFTTLRNIVLLPFATDQALWTALYAGLRQSTTLQDIMISGEGGCTLHDDIVTGIVSSINRTKIKRLRLNNATLGQRGMQSLCDLLLHSSITFLDLSGSSFSLESVAMFANMMPQMTKLHVIDLKETRDDNQKSWNRETLETFLEGLCGNDTLEEVILSYTSETIDLKSRRDFYLQRNRSRNLLVENVMSVWPEVFMRLGDRSQTSLMYYLLKERLDILFAANSTRLKRTASESSNEIWIEPKKVKASESSLLVTPALSE